MFGATDKGLVRSINQDAYTCDAGLGLVVLSDGMGGHAAGEVASHMVVEGLSEALASLGKFAVEELPARIDETIQKVNTKLIMKSQEDQSCRGMGATVNVLCFVHGFVTIGHVGDSRTYLIRAFKTADQKPRFGIWPLTIDHNLGTFIDRGIVTVNSQSSDPQMTLRERSKLTRGMGVMPDPKPDIYTRRLEVGDVFLTCSDGLHGFVSDKDVLKSIVTGNLVEAPQRLVELAKAAGAPDNVTVVLSIVSDLVEPFRDFNEPVYQSRPYLLRLPNGEIQGPFTCSKIVDMWIKRDVPGETELAAALGPWIMLRNKDQLTKLYTEFNNEVYNNYIYYEASYNSEYDSPQSNVSAPVEQSKHESKSRKPRVLLAALTGLLIVACCWYFIAREIELVLLPAY
jgi:protein phosphatase